ncbi:hypothetical protein DL96DRAFT_1688052 [Flagelloscypha sp. PMI_526]|nr:hypothetical protein DL96DRAFT_1688052 [Flagelloscypha sp. PMI_526]
MVLFKSLFVSASILAGLVAASPAPSLSGLLFSRQSFKIPLDDVPDKYPSQKEFSDTTKKARDDACKSTGTSTTASSAPATTSAASSNSAMPLTITKSAAGIMFSFGVAALIAL